MSKGKHKVSRLQREIDFVQFLNDLKTGETISLDADDNPPWFEEGKIYRVSETTFAYHLESYQPKWLDKLGFVFDCGHGPFLLFWKTDGQYFARQLTKEENFNFCRLSGTKFYT